MKSILAPIHTAALGKSTLRFFKSPLAGPDLPWHVHDDLLECLELPPDVKAVLTRKLINHWKQDIKSVATSEGIVTIAPHYVAQGLIGAAVQVGMAGAAFENQYIAAAIAAFKVMTGDLAPLAAVQMAIAATKTSLEKGS